jgi:hypothetical protein
MLSEHSTVYAWTANAQELAVHFVFISLREAYQKLSYPMNQGDDFTIICDK